MHLMEDLILCSILLENIILHQDEKMLLVVSRLGYVCLKKNVVLIHIFFSEIKFMFLFLAV